MLEGIENDLLHLLNILESIEKIMLYSVHACNAEEFYDLNDQLNFNGSLNLFDVIMNDLKPLKNAISFIISNEVRKKSFNHEEFSEAIGSSYYRHIDFKDLS